MRFDNYKGVAPLVSLVIPVLGDADTLTRLLESVPPDPRLEIIVADAGGDTATSRPDVRIVRSAPGRGRQMNTGARVATGTWLFFLHADSRLPPRWLDTILDASRSPDVVGGWFRLRLDAPGWQPRVIERLVRLRVRLLHLAYGDQGYFVRRELFEAMGGYAELPLMEDVEFVRRLVRAGATVESPLSISTSARRWQRDGWFRRSTRNLVLVSLYFAGVRPATLARWYERRAPPR